ncbi:MAG: hypothetical protein V4808_06160 [Pseudomonadota bacterium]
MRHFILATACVLIAAPSLPPVLAAPAPKPVSQCKNGETALYSCRFGKSVGSVCASSGAVHYRFGPAGKPNLDIASNSDWSNVHLGGVIGGGGGSEQHLRFTNGDHDYVVFWGVQGSLHDNPGKKWSGIHVAQGAKQVSQLACKSNTYPSSEWRELLEASLPENVSEVPEDKDPRFDMWL